MGMTFLFGRGARTLLVGDLTRPLSSFSSRYLVWDHLMATAQAHPAPRAAATSSTSHSMSSSTARVSRGNHLPEENARSSTRSQAIGMEERKRRLEAEDAKAEHGRYLS